MSNQVIDLSSDGSFYNNSNSSNNINADSNGHNAKYKNTNRESVDEVIDLTNTEDRQVIRIDSESCISSINSPSLQIINDNEERPLLSSPCLEKSILQINELTSELSEQDEGDSIEILGLKRDHGMPDFLVSLNKAKPAVLAGAQVEEMPTLKRKAEKSARKFTSVELDMIYEREKQVNLKRLQLLNKKKSKQDIIDEMKIAISTKAHEYFLTLNPDYLGSVSLSHELFEYPYPIIKFRRYVKAVYNYNKLSFIPVENHWIDEDIIVLVYDTTEFVNLLPDHKFRQILKSIKHEDESRKVIIFLNNYDKYMNKIKVKFNKRFNDLANKHLNKNRKDIISPKKRKSKSPIADENDDKFKNLKPEHISIQLKKYEARGFTFQLVSGLIQILDWLNSYTYSIGKRVYDNFELNRDIAHLGVEKSGDGPTDTFKKILITIPRLSERKSNEIMKNKNFNSLQKMSSNLNNQNINDLKAILQSDVIKSLQRFFSSTNENELI